MKKKKLKAIMLAACIMSMAVPASVMAAPENEIEIVTEEAVEEEGTEMATEDADDQETEESTETVAEDAEGKGDGDIDYIYTSNCTSATDINTSQVSISAKIPENFENAYIVLLNMQTGQMYYSALYAQNGYKDHFFVPEGDYMIVEQGIYGDNTNRYPFTPVENFSVTPSSPVYLTTALVDYDKIEQEMQEKKREREEFEERMKAQDNEEETEEKEQKKFDKIESDFDVTAEITSHSELAIIGKGNQKSEFFLVFQFDKDGMPGETNCKVSYDNGKIFEDLFVPLSGVINDKKTGLTYRFQTEGFKAGDTFKCFVGDPTKEITYENTSSGGFTLTTVEGDGVYAFDVLAENFIDIVVNIKRTGDMQTAVFDVTVVSDDGTINSTSEEMYIPENGDYILEDYGLVMHFDGSYFAEGNVFTAHARYPEETDYTSLYILGGVLGAAAMLGLAFLKGKQTKDSEYELHEYKSYSGKLPEKKKKKKAKDGE